MGMNPIYKCREEIPTLNDKCAECKVKSICFSEGKEGEIYRVHNKCKEFLTGLKPETLRRLGY